MENPSNYEELPATFVLQFPKQLAMSLELLKSISNCLERSNELFFNKQLKILSEGSSSFLSNSCSEILNTYLKISLVSQAAV